MPAFAHRRQRETIASGAGLPDVGHVQLVTLGGVDEPGGVLMVDAVTASRFPRRDTYDLADIADLVIELHSCVHNAASDIAGMRGDLGAHRLEVAERLGHVGERVAKLEGKSEAIGQRLGVVDSAPTQKPAFPKPWQIIGAICGGVGGFLAIYKVCVALLPALHKALMTVS